MIFALNVTRSLAQRSHNMKLQLENLKKHQIAIQWNEMFQHIRGFEEMYSANINSGDRVGRTKSRNSFRFRQQKHFG